MFKTPYDFNANGDGVADDYQPLQDWFDAIESNAGILPPGIFLSSQTLKVHSHTTVYGTGGQLSIIKAHPSLLTDENDTQNQLLTNANVVGDVATRTDGAINFYNVGFQRHPTKRTAASMLGFAGVSGLVFRDCTLAHARRFLSAFSACTDVTFDNCDLYDFGSLDPVPQPGRCLYDGGYAIWAGVESNSNFSVINCRIRDGQWTGIHAAGERWTIANNEILRVHEAGIFGGPTHSTITGNRINTVRLKDCEANGIEIGGRENVISNNVIDDTDHGSIYLTNVINYNVRGNVCTRASQQKAANGVPDMGMTGVITVRNAAGLGQLLDNLLLCDNIIADNTGRSTYGIALYDMGGGPMQNLCCTGNNLGSATQWKGAPIFVDLSVPGLNFTLKDNPGAP